MFELLPNFYTKHIQLMVQLILILKYMESKILIINNFFLFFKHFVHYQTIKKVL